MKIIHFLYSGMGGHGDVVFPKMESQRPSGSLFEKVKISGIPKKNRGPWGSLYRDFLGIPWDSLEIQGFQKEMGDLLIPKRG